MSEEHRTESMNAPGNGRVSILALCAFVMACASVAALIGLLGAFRVPSQELLRRYAFAGFAIAAAPAAIAALSAVAIFRILRSRGALCGRGLAIGALIVALLAAPCSIGLPRLLDARASAFTTLCRSNLKRAGLAVMMYRRDNGADYPPSLQALSDTGYIEDLSILKCPASGGRAPVDPQDVDRTCDYYLARARNTGEDSCGTSVMWDKRATGHRAVGVNVLFEDGHVIWFAGDGIVELLEKSASLYEEPLPLPAVR